MYHKRSNFRSKARDAAHRAATSSGAKTSSWNFNPYAVLQDLIPQKRTTERKSGSKHLTREQVPVATRRTDATALREKLVVSLPLPVYYAGQQDTQDIKTFKNATSEEDLRPYHDSSDDESGGFDHEDIKELVRLMEQRELDYPLSSSDAPLDYEPIAWDDLPGYSGNYSLADQDYMYNYLTHTGAYLWGDYEARRAQPSLKHLPHRLPDMGAQAPCQTSKRLLG
jgi:hypothetical protein